MPAIVILIGITGDLSRRKLVPALAALREKGALPEHFKLLGISRKEGIVIEGADMLTMDLDDPADYAMLAKLLEAIEKGFGMPAQRLFYLSVAPAVSLPIIERLGATGLAAVPHTKLLLEKPFGTDADDAAAFISAIREYFSDEQVYRVDHYLAKDAVRALASAPIEKEGLQEIEICARERITIEGRAAFYEQTGALRDIIQSHLLAVLATALGGAERLPVLRSLSIPTDAPIAEYVQRGQYEGYREAVHNPDSATETFVSVALQSSDPALKDVAITLMTGKALDRKATEIRLSYAHDPSAKGRAGMSNAGASVKTIRLDDPHNAYEYVFASALSGGKACFVPPEEVAEDWRIIAPIQDAWKSSSDGLFQYPQGSAL